MEAIESDRRLTPNQKVNALQGLKHELTSILKTKLTPVKPQPKKNIDGDKIDFTLLNKLKSAIVKGDFSLLKVYKEHYKGLASIEDLESLAKASASFFWNS